MARYRKYSRSRSRNQISYAHERALEHIREAKQLSKELGGTDEDVKKYFFALDSVQLQALLKEYEVKHGRNAREYAEATIPKWRAGMVHMSGTVAERLFKLLPPRMPLETKFQLIETLWKHVGPSSNKTYYIGIDANPDEIARTIQKHLEEVVVNYRIPSTMEKRFDWLSQGDAVIKQQLLNHFRQSERQLLTEALRTQLPVLLAHLKSEQGTMTTYAAQVLRVGKHEVKIVPNRQTTGIAENTPPRKTSSANPWMLWIIGIALLFLVLILVRK